MKHALFLALLSASFATFSQAAPKQENRAGEKPTVSKEEQAPDSPVVPKYNTQRWVPARYAEIKKNMAEKKCDIFMVGDSITEQWEVVGRKLWNELLAPKNAINFGISGDKTENVLWRIQDTKLNTQTEPKVCTLLIGTNNIGAWKGRQSAKETVQGIEKIAKALLEKFPKTHLIIFTTFPYGTDPAGPLRKLGDEIGKETQKLKLPRTTVVNFNKYFLQPDGKFQPGVFKDGVHLSEKGYQIWAKHMMPLLEKYLDKNK